jgi:hypothetical protein
MFFCWGLEDRSIETVVQTGLTFPSSSSLQMYFILHSFQTNASFNYCFSLSSLPLPLPLLLSKKRAWKRLRHRDVGMRPSLSFEAALVVHVSLQDFKLRIHSTCPCDVEMRLGFMDGLRCLVSSLVYKFCSSTSSRKSIVRTLFYIHLYTPWMF